MSDSKVIMFPESTGSVNTSMFDPNLLFSTIMNNGGFGGNGNWMWIIFLFLLFGNGNGFGFGNGNALGTGYLSNQITNTEGRELLMQAINGNGNALQQLASTLSCDVNSIKTAISSINSSLCQLGNQVGMSAADIKNAITTGNMTLAQQLSNCCCNIRESITSQGYQNQLQILQQTNALQNSINNVAVGQERGFSSLAFENQSQTCALTGTLKDSTASVLAKLDAIEDARKDREITDLTAKLTAANSRAERAAELAPIYKALSDIECKQPNTVTVPYQPFVTVPNCVAGQFCNGLYNVNNGSIWS